VAIGSGNNVAEYVAALESINQSPISVLKGEVGRLGGSAERLASRLVVTLRQNPRLGISEHVHYVVVSRSHTQIAPIGISDLNADGTLKYNPPAVAHGREDFQRFAASRGLVAGEAGA
jgi:hypothetical protein